MKLFATIFKIFMWPLRLIGAIFAKILVISIILLIFLLGTGNFWLPKVTELFLRAKSGFNVSIYESDGSLFSANIDFKGLLIENPRDVFSDRNFISFNECAVDIDMNSIFSDTFVVERMVLDIDDITIVKNVDGSSNVSLFIKNITSEKNSGSKSSRDLTVTDEKKSRYNGFVVQEVLIKLGTVHIIDELPVPVERKVYTINYEKELKNVQSLDEIQAVITRDLSRYGVELLLESVTKSIFNLPGLRHGHHAAKGGVRGVTAGAKGIFNGIKSIFQK